MVARTRGWRRDQQEIKLKLRMNYLRSGQTWYHGYKDVNGVRHQTPNLNDFIGSFYHFKYKTISTIYSDHKCKFSRCKGRGTYYISRKNKNTEEFERQYFKNLLIEHGLKHL